MGTNIVSTVVYFSNSMGSLAATPSLICGSSGTTTLTLGSLSTQNAAWQYQYSDDGGITYPTGWATFSTAVTLSQPYSLIGTSVLRIYQFKVNASNNVCSPVTSNIVTVNIAPVPIVTTSSQTVFSTQTTSLGLSSTVTGSTFNFTPIGPANVSGTSAGSGATISQALTVTDGVNPGTVTYSVTPSANGCTGAPVNAIVSVYPLPVISSSANRFSMGPITLTAQSLYDTYAWKNSSGTILGTSSNFQATTADKFSVTVTKTINSSTATVTSNPYSILGQFEGQSANFIVTNQLLVDNISSGTRLDALTPYEVSQTIQYFDGLGRLSQTVNTQVTPLKKDLVQPAIYDGFGRESLKYLPYTSIDQSGWYKTDPTGSVSGNYSASPHYAFYNAANDKVADDINPYSETKFEPSPLNRVLEQGAPGSPWQPGSGHTITRSYSVNTLNEVYFFSYDPASSSVSLSSDPVLKYYAVNQLYANHTQDEKQNEVIEYTDKRGHTVCKKVQSGTSGTTKVYASTYYIYDDLGNLVVVLPPEAINSDLNLYIK